jgi:hypothetical protein
MNYENSNSRIGKLQYKIEANNTFMLSKKCQASQKEKKTLLLYDKWKLFMSMKVKKSPVDEKLFYPWMWAQNLNNSTGLGGGGRGGSWPSDIKRENLIKLFLCKPGKNREEEKERWRIIILFDRQI